MQDFAPTETNSELDDLSVLQNTPFDVIPIDGVATKEEIQAYNENPAVAEMLRYDIVIDKNELAEDQIKAAGEQGEAMRLALLTNNRDAMRHLVDAATVYEQYIVKKFNSLSSANGQIPVEYLQDVTYAKPDLYEISKIYKTNILTPISGDSVDNSPMVRLKGVDADIIQDLPARNLPTMWLDSTYHVNQLRIIGRLADVKKDSE